MYRILLIPVNSPNPVALFYETRDAAVASQKNIHDMQRGVIEGVDVLTAKDDMGHVVTMHRNNISYALFIDADAQPEKRPTASAHHGNGLDKPSIIL